MQEFFKKIFNNKYVAMIIDSILCIVIIILLICVIIKLRNKNNVSEENLVVEEQEEEKTEELAQIKVNIKGEIANAGVYELNEGSTINDLINSSGGLTNKADIKNISLSTILTDEMLVVIPSVTTSKKTTSKVVETETKEELIESNQTIPEVVEKGKVTITSKYNETLPAKTETEENNSDTNISSNNINSNNSNVTTSEQQDNNNNNSSIDNDIVNEEEPKVEENPEEDEVIIVNINTATIEELTKLNGIGESKAQAIIDYRNTNGPFKAIEDILNVKGIGEKIYDKIKEFITV